MNKYPTHKWVVVSVAVIMDTLLFGFLIYFGINNNLLNWGPDWWYSLYTLIQGLSIGYVVNWRNKED